MLFLIELLRVGMVRDYRFSTIIVSGILFIFLYFYSKPLKFILMEKLDFSQMEDLHGGKLTREEVETFIGVASCASVWMGWLNIVGCAYWISTL